MFFVEISALLALLVAPSLGAGSVCTSGIYGLLAPLANYPPAEAYCSSHDPQVVTTIVKRHPHPHPQYSTTTKPSTTTKSTSTTKAPTTTSSSTTKSSTTATSSSTTKSSTTTTKPPTTTTTLKTTTTSADPKAVLFSSLVAQAQGVVSTLCSCIEKPVTKTITPSTTSTTTVSKNECPRPSRS